jgi:hypothetical protein
MKKLPILSLFAVILSACGFAEPSSSSQGVQSSVSQSASSNILTSQSSITSSTVTTSTATSSSSMTTSQNLVVGIGRALFGYVDALPETTAFLPSFLVSETYHTTKNVENLDYYNGFINKTDLPTKYFGAQLDQLRTHIGLMDGLTENLTSMLAKASALGNLYSDYISSNPANPYAFNTTYQGFSFTITGLANELIVKVSVGDANITMAVLDVQGTITYWIDVYISDQNRVVIYATPTRLVVIGNAVVSAVQVSYLLEIIKTGNNINGYSYERYGTESAALKQHIVFKTEGNYFVVAGERGDFILGASPKVNVETYDKTTGQYLGSQVLETIPVTGPTYETIWYPMWSMNGWTSIKFELDNNDAKEFPQVYLNGSNSLFDVHYNSLLGVTTSRKYDIELKKSYVYVLENNKWVKKEFYYPAFFIQQSEITLANPFGTANKRNGNLFSHTLTATQQEAIRTNYAAMKTEQAAYKSTNVDNVITNFLNSIKRT